MLDQRGDRRADQAAVQRLVLVGASNLTKGIGAVLDTALAIWGGPLEVLAAFGHGRSYGRSTRVLTRELPGIGPCGLWADLSGPARVPTSALVTDIGNDLLYEEPVERIAGWVEECFDRLAAAGASTVVTLLPLGNLPGISAARFTFFRTLFVPRSRIGLEQVVRRAGELDACVERLAVERGFATIRPRTEWYGLDPIHIRFGRRRRAWREILSLWTPGDPLPAASRGALVRTLYLRTRTPQRRRLLGFEQRGTNPAARLSDGTWVALY
ncbi:MAG: hypothetical protein WDZ48_05555 [Pirellulales bacterium]